MPVQTTNHSQAPRQPLGRALLVLLVAVVVTGGTCVLLTYLAPPPARMLVAWYGGVLSALLTVAATVAAYAVETARHRNERLALMQRDAARLADEMMPDLVGRLRARTSAATVLSEVEYPAEPAHQRVLTTLTEEIANGERMRSAATASCANAAGRVQALTTSMLADLRDMENRHGEEVLGDLLKLDHSTAQAGRLADSIAVLTGARSGRRWTKPIVMESILRGAVGRINAYQRVKMHNTCKLAVAGYAAEGVMHALAELMDNATSFSPPSEQVHVYVEEVQAGIVVTIEDGGLVMGDQSLRRAEEAVSADTLDLSALSGTRLGLAVVGCLARKHGLTISFRPSSRGGTGVIVMIPRKIITEPRRRHEAPAGRRREPAQAAARPAVGAAQAVAAADAAARTDHRPEPAADPATEPLSGAEAGAASMTGSLPTEHAPTVDADGPAAPDEKEPLTLPKRRRGRTLANSRMSTPTESKPAAPRPDAGARFGAFRRASRGEDTDAVSREQLPREGGAEEETS